jgi:ATP-dependent DNA helicase PIF1
MYYEEDIDTFSKDLNPLQVEALRHVILGNHLFLTGAGGTGKSFTIDRIVNWARYRKKRIGITSSTGTSALTIRGQTLHSFLGLRVYRENERPEGIVAAKSLKKYNNLKFKRVQELDILIIDEISMVSADFLDYISSYMWYVRHSFQDYYPSIPEFAFGKIQIILCGDLLQLPPVERGAKFCFESKVFQCLIDNAKLKTVGLINSKRQESDQNFVNILNSVRFGKLSNEMFLKLRSLTHANFGEVRPTLLYCTNKDVDGFNSTEYQKLVDSGAIEIIFETVFSDNEKTQEWFKSLRIEPVVKLAIGAQVMLTYNLDVEGGLVNGSRGVVVGFQSEGPVVLFKDGDQVVIEYVTVNDTNMERTCIKPECNEEANYNRKGSFEPEFCHKHKTDTMERIFEIWVKFMPLKLAWAMTIHKSQSATLDCAVLSLADCFACGQAYTALSRVRDMKSLVIQSIHKHSFKASPEVIDFYERNGLMG